MKFAKELERDLVPEWRLKYLDYKAGKKKLKAISRALRRVDQTPRLRRRGTTVLPTPFDAAPKYAYINRGHGGGDRASARDPEELRTLALTNSRHSAARQRPNSSQLGTTPEEEPLALGKGSHGRHPGLGASYGSFVASPPKDGNGRAKRFSESSGAPSLTLPGAALDPNYTSPSVGPSALALQRTRSITLPPAELETDHAMGKMGAALSKTRPVLPVRYKSVFTPKRMNSMPGNASHSKGRPSARRIFSLGSKTPPISPADAPLEAYRDLDLKQAEFFNFLDQELDKIETFYKEKEDEATLRLSVLHEQLHIMRDQRIDDIISRQTAKIKAKAARTDGENDSPGHKTPQDHKGNGHVVSESWLNPIDAALEAINAGKYGRSTRNITQLATPAIQPKKSTYGRHDFARRPEQPDVPYQTAKRKLKVALQEYYRGLELLKSYALLNRTAFRKINKKYDKTVNARPTMRYMTEKVNQAWFVNSDVIEGHIRATEDLYARYFERGNHKVAVGKLRIKIARAGDYTDNTFRNGLLLAAGAILGVQGVIKAIETADLRTLPDAFSLNTSYLLQVYAGFFLINFLLLLFCLACRVWHETKINYVFIFEYDTRHYLDWRQLSELPCWYFFMLGLCMQLNFHQVGGNSIYLYYPVILLGINVVVLFNPIKMFYFRTRMWLLYSLWRLLLAGIYPVEWRDFYLGDMFCSLTYSMGNIALFFCLYARKWDTPGQCNSSHLRVFGFMTTLPGIWRGLQCIRRYWDTGNKFPHLLNCGKYTATILFYMTLSVYRTDKRPSTHAAFITFAIINSMYTSFWDIYYDWSLGDPHAKNRFLRKELGYKKIWWYYTAMVIDPILRFNWVLYTIMPLQLQHSAVTSFAISVSEICRRGMWSLFRVENEHCTNVGRFRASRDVPLPYSLPASPKPTPRHGRSHTPKPIDEEQALTTGTASQPRTPTATRALSASTTGAEARRSRSAAMRQRRAFPVAPDGAVRPSPFQRALTHVGDIFRGAHAQDFERKRKPELGRDPRNTKMDDDESEDESDGEERSAEQSGGEEMVFSEEEEEQEEEEDQEQDDLRGARADLERGLGERMSGGDGGDGGEGPVKGKGNGNGNGKGRVE